MPKFEWICHDCNIYWEKEYPVGKAPQRTKCPECGKLCEKNWQGQNVSVSFGDDKDFHTVRSRYQKVAKKGWDKDAGDRFLRTSIEATKNAMTDESFRYRPVNFDVEAMAKDGLAKPLSDKEIAKKQEISRNLTAQAYDNANERGFRDAKGGQLDITKPQKQQ